MCIHAKLRFAMWHGNQRKHVLVWQKTRRASFCQPKLGAVKQNNWSTCFRQTPLEARGVSFCPRFIENAHSLVVTAILVRMNTSHNNCRATTQLDRPVVDQVSHDTIPYEDYCQTTGPNEAGMITQQFLAFNTVITLQAFGDPDHVRAAFDAARAQCRTYERLFSRTLAHSDIARINNAGGKRVSISSDTAKLIQAALYYCQQADSLFDITIGKAVALWNFHEGTIAPEKQLKAALAHVNWKNVHVEQTNDGAFAYLDDPEAALDLGGIAKGWMADQLTELLESEGLSNFIVNLGGNVVVRGEKPNGQPWRVGLQDPFNKEGILGGIELTNASAVTSGTYERSFTHDGKTYHHILDPKTGYPVETDAAGVTVVTRNSLDAEGYSTTLLALGIERGLAFAKMHPEILNVFFVDQERGIYTLR